MRPWSSPSHHPSILVIPRSSHLFIVWQEIEEQANALRKSRAATRAAAGEAAAVRAQRNDHMERAATLQSRLRESQHALRMAGAEVAALRETVAASLGLPDLSELGSPWGRGPRGSSDSEDDIGSSPLIGLSKVPGREAEGLVGDVPYEAKGGSARRALLLPCSPRGLQSKPPASPKGTAITPAGQVVDGATDGRGDGGSSALLRTSLSSIGSGYDPLTDTLADQENTPPPSMCMNGSAPLASEVCIPAHCTHVTCFVPLHVNHVA